MSTKVLTAFFEQLLSCKVLLLPYDYYLQIKLLSPVNCKNFYSALRFLRKSFFGQLSVRVLFCDEGALQIFLGSSKTLDFILNNDSDFVISVC
jgi:hypothetical protein